MLLIRVVGLFPMFFPTSVQHFYSFLKMPLSSTAILAAGPSCALQWGHWSWLCVAWGSLLPAPGHLHPIQYHLYFMRAVVTEGLNLHS